MHSPLLLQSAQLQFSWTTIAKVCPTCSKYQAGTDSGTALVEAQKVISSHEATIDKLQQELFELGGTIAQGNLVPPGKRVLELAQNPLTIWAEMQQSNLDRLKNENTALLMRLAELEQQGAALDSVLSLVPRDSLERAQGETEQLKDELAKKEKRFDRLSKVRPPRALSGYTERSFASGTRRFSTQSRRNSKMPCRCSLDTS